MSHPGDAWHKTVRNDGFETLNVAGGAYRTMTAVHEREGFGGNDYSLDQDVLEERRNERDH